MSENVIYQNLKQDIIQLNHRPGEVFRERDLMETYGAGRSQIREVLLRLEMNGFVRIIPNVGTFVEDVSFQKLKEVFEVRSNLVRLNGFLAAERINDEELAEIRLRISRMKSTNDNETLIRLDSEIHEIINRASKNDILVKILNDLHDQAVRIWKFTGIIDNYWKDLEEEFEDIADALEQHDGEVSASLLEKHAKRFVENISRQLTF